MNKKLMKKTALVGSILLMTSVASLAQTTVSGNFDISYKAVTNKKSPVDSYNGFGKESQINIANKGKLNNGLDYAAGFSLEFDGNDVGGANTGWQSENQYIDLISGGTTVSFGIDHIQNPDSHAHVNMVGVGYIGGDGLGGPLTGTKTGSSIYPTNAFSQYQSYGVGIIQTTDIGKFSFNYVPTASYTTVQTSGSSTYQSATSNGTIGGPDIGNSATVGNYENTGESAMEIGFTGNLGVKGLNILAFYNTSNEIDANKGGNNYTGKVIGGNYNFGQFTVGADWRKQNSAASATTNTELTGKSVGVAYAITPNVSLGAVYAKAEMSGNSTAALASVDTEKSKIVSIGYNMGPVVLNGQYRETDNVSGASSVNGDAKDAIVKLSTKF